MRWESGEAVTQGELRRILGQAGVAMGIPWESVGTHSLRFGGASAIFQCSGGNSALVKRLGRWSSDVYEGYVWEDRLLTKGLSSQMITAPWAVNAGLLASRRAEA